MNSFAERFDTIDQFLDYSLNAPSGLSEPARRELDGYYGSYKKNFSAHIRKHYSSQVREVEALIKRQGELKILEVGCGCGTEAIWFAGHGASVVGIDLSKSRLQVARERARSIKEEFKTQLDLDLNFASLFDLDRDSDFDIVWMEQAFHHIEPRDQVAPTVRRLLKPGGRLILSEPNAWNPLVQLSFLRRRGFKTIAEFRDDSGRQHKYGVERITVPLALSNRFEKDGFETEELRYFRILPNFPWAEAVGFLEKLFPQWFVPVFTHYNMVFRKQAGMPEHATVE